MGKLSEIFHSLFHFSEENYSFTLTELNARPHNMINKDWEGRKTSLWKFYIERNTLKMLIWKRSCKYKRE